ncbi:MAG: phosphatase PAP2 family protein [Chloroflexi bacterium]|nr:phosphatase PAP2 family protein [Chloroflexota bacterium]MBA3740958.1 phosphatase PAP2 family protein [Chloroflexota bacterium]
MAPPIALAAGGVALVIALAVGVSLDLTDGFDHAVIQAVRAPALQGILAPLGIITELGSTWAITVIAAVTLLVGVAIGPWRHGLIGAVTIGLASIANSSMKLAIARERPELLEPIIVERGFSFPSSHSALGMVAYGVLAVLVSRSRLPLDVRRAVISGLVVLIGLIGISRIWLGVHYPTDVLAGWAAGAVIVLAYATLTRRVSPAPAEVAVDADPAAPRSDRPAPG